MCLEDLNESHKPNLDLFRAMVTEDDITLPPQWQCSLNESLQNSRRMPVGNVTSLLSSLLTWI
jgi:hypothetical protein